MKRSKTKKVDNCNPRLKNCPVCPLHDCEVMLCCCPMENCTCLSSCLYSAAQSQLNNPLLKSSTRAIHSSLYTALNLSLYVLSGFFSIAALVSVSKRIQAHESLIYRNERPLVRPAEEEREGLIELIEPNNHRSGSAQKKYTKEFENRISNHSMKYSLVLTAVAMLTVVNGMFIIISVWIPSDTQQRCWKPLNDTIHACLSSLNCTYDSCF